jgi:hypothetical protein
MKLRYKPLEVEPSKSTSRKITIWRPIIPVILIYKKGMVGYEALIDSGADFNVFHSEIAQILDIDYKRGKKRQIFGLGNQEINGYECDVEIKLQGFPKFESSVVFSNQIPPHSFGVLGNKGFFGHFEIKFDYALRSIEIN